VDSGQGRECSARLTFFCNCVIMSEPKCSLQILFWQFECGTKLAQVFQATPKPGLLQ
jgi:hypothetical protein